MVPQSSGHPNVSNETHRGHCCIVIRTTTAPDLLFFALVGISARVNDRTRDVDFILNMGFNKNRISTEKKIFAPSMEVARPVNKTNKQQAKLHD